MIYSHRLLLYYGDTLLGDLNHIAKNRRLVENLKSEVSSPQADTFTFTINWVLFQRFIAKVSEEQPATFLKVGKTRIVFEENGKPIFGGYLASRPARSGTGASQNLELTFYEYFARLSGDLICSTSDKLDPYVRFENRPAHLYTKDLIDLFISHAEDAGETLNWDYGTVDTLANKTIEYKDFQTISKALCDAMDNVTGAGKYDVVFYVDPEDYTHVLIDILKPRGSVKNTIIRYPGDGVYKLWSADFSVEETNEYASEVLIAGNGQVGDVDEGEQTANLGVAENTDFAEEYCYFRVYQTRSNLSSQNAVDAAAETELENLSFKAETPRIRLVGVPILWGDKDEGLAVGDTFTFLEETDDLADNSGQYRIIGLERTWDDNGVCEASPTLQKVEEEE